VKLAERAWDLLAVALITSGTALYLLARRGLAALSNGTYQVPEGVTWVSRADLHVTQTRLAAWCIAVGITLAVVATIRHKMRARLQSQARTRS
jgi:hypothetical protein